MNHRPPRSAVVALSVLIASAGAAGISVAEPGSAPARHVLLISVDGLHASDVTKCIAAHLCPNIANLSAAGTSYSLYQRKPPPLFGRMDR